MRFCSINDAFANPAYNRQTFRPQNEPVRAETDAIKERPKLFIRIH